MTNFRNVLSIKKTSTFRRIVSYLQETIVELNLFETVSTAVVLAASRVKSLKYLIKAVLCPVMPNNTWHNHPQIPHIPFTLLSGF